MQWFFWAIASAFFAGLTALLAKIGVSELNSNLATAIRTSVILVFTWAIVFVTSGGIDLQGIGRKTWIFLVLSGIAIFARSRSANCPRLRRSINSVL